MIHVIAVITAQPGQRTALLNLFRANVQAVRAEAGCTAHDPCPATELSTPRK